MSTENLAPCPFCGGAAVRQNEKWIACECGATAPARAWQRRATVAYAAPAQPVPSIYKQIGWVHPVYLDGNTLSMDVSTVCLSEAQLPVFIRVGSVPVQDAEAKVEQVARAIYAHTFTTSIPRMGIRTATFEEVWNVPAERERMTQQARAAIDAMADV